MKQRIVLVGILFLIFLNVSHSQSYSGFLADNYNGVHGVISNPANISDSRLALDINLFGISAFFGNNYIGFDLSNAFDNINTVFNTAEQTPLKSNFLAANMDLLGPSIMLGIDKKSALAVYTRGRFLFNIDDIDGSLLEKEGGFNEDEAFSIQEERVSGAINLWTEVGATYSRVLFHKDQHFIKGGLSLKYLMGMHHAYLYGENLNVAFNPETDVVTTSGILTYGNDVSNSDGGVIDFFQGSDSKGFGADLGFIYEWRPDYAKFKSSSVDGKTITDKGANKYKLKFGVSITDIGSIKNNEGEEGVYDLNEVQNLDNFDGADLEDALQDNFALLGGFGSSAKTSLPTTLRANVDWSLHRMFYLNFNSDISLVSKSKHNANHIVNTYSISPRLETKWYSLYAPLSVAQGIGFQWGMGLRAGPLYLGSGTILTTLLGESTKSLDLYAGLKVPIYYGRQKDRDQDGLYDSIDDCPKVAGPKENNGCPWKDSDDDGVLDKDDTCPKTQGPTENMGCPWPDTDGDGLLDKDDDCPNKPGTIENKGCPWKDTDGDGIFDKDDDCPNQPGLTQFNGCPDKDGDGLMDKEDRCPEVAGKIENKGCPDKDNDSLVDIDDQCPDLAGPISNKGCPEVTEEVQKQLNSYAKTILFDTGKSTIKSESLSVMIDIINILNEYPNARFTVEGHTDSVGSATSNQRLSEARANSVRDFLIKEKIEANKLTAIGYGEDRPIESNSTREGRKQNRRVEINLIK